MHAKHFVFTYASAHLASPNGRPRKSMFGNIGLIGYIWRTLNTVQSCIYWLIVWSIIPSFFQGKSFLQPLVSWRTASRKGRLQQLRRRQPKQLFLPRCRHMEVMWLPWLPHQLQHFYLWKYWSSWWVKHSKVEMLQLIRMLGQLQTKVCLHLSMI